MTTTTQNVLPDFTVKQAAKQLSATPQIVRKAISDGLLKSYKISQRNTRITQNAIDQFRDNGGVAMTCK